MSGLDIEGVLAAHEPEVVEGFWCSCSDYRLDVPWFAHVAAVLREEVAAAQAEARADERARITAGIKRERDNYYTDTQNEGFDVAGRIARNGGHL